MVITSLQEKQNRKFYVPIRPGNRGGWSLFQWQSVREMPYRDRQMYLGNSAVIGVLDKGGKWRKRDWYLKADKGQNPDRLKSEQQEAIRKDQQRMNSHLGIKEMEDEQHLNEDEMREIMKRLKLKKQGQDYKEAVGLGFDKTKVQIRAKPTINKDGISRLEGYDEIEEYQKEEKEKVQREKHKHKKEKKQKKHKRHHSSQGSESKQRHKKHKNREHSRSRSKDRRRKQEKHKKDKDRKRQRSYSKQKQRKHRHREQKQERHEKHEKKHKKQKKHRRHYSDSQ